MNVNDLLDERGERYGCFSGQALLSQGLKRVMASSKNWSQLSDMQRESLEMIVHKIARILNGDPNYEDSWVDIGGYANLPLVVKEKHIAWVESLREEIKKSVGEDASASNIAELREEWNTRK